MAKIELKSDQDLLVVVDVQNDFCPGGALEVADGDAVVGLTNQLMTAFDHVVLTQDWHPADHSSFASSYEGKNPFDMVDLSYGAQNLWPDHCIQGTTGADFHSDLDIHMAELVIRKGFRSGIDSYSAFFENDKTTPTGFGGYLRERGFKRLFMVGIATDFCVAFSAIDGRSEGFEVFVIDDACRGIDLDGSLAAAWQQMEAAGVSRISSGDVD